MSKEYDKWLEKNEEFLMEQFLDGFEDYCETKFRLEKWTNDN